MIEFIAHHPISVPLTKILDPPIPVCLPDTPFERIKIDVDVLETKITGDRIVLIHKSTFLREISVKESPENFKFQEPAT